MDKMGYYSERMMRNWGLTMSLRKLDEKLSAGELTRRERDAAAAYVFFNKKDKLNQVAFPNLFKEVSEFEESLKEKDPTNTKFKVYLTLEHLANKKKTDNELRDKFREYLLSSIEENDVSLNALAKKTNVHYSNLYNFLYKNENKLSFDKLREVRKVFNK